MNIELVEYGSLEYIQTRNLRNDILRKPLGLNLFERDLTIEFNSMHFAVIDGKAVIACVVAEPHSKSVVKIRQMAVSEPYQGIGIGARLMIYAEKVLQKKSFTYIYLNARKDVVLFYLKLGYKCVGKEFLEVTIPHIKMEKDI